MSGRENTEEFFKRKDAKVVSYRISAGIEKQTRIPTKTKQGDFLRIHFLHTTNS